MLSSLCHVHPMQSIIELSRTQDEEVGDGTTSVIILGALLVKWAIDGPTLHTGLLNRRVDCSWRDAAHC